MSDFINLGREDWRRSWDRCLELFDMPHRIPEEHGKTGKGGFRALGGEAFRLVKAPDGSYMSVIFYAAPEGEEALHRPWKHGKFIGELELDANGRGRLELTADLSNAHFSDYFRLMTQVLERFE